MKTKYIPITATLITMYTGSAYGTLPVIDYSKIAQDAYSEVMNYAKYAAEYAKQVEQYSLQLNQYEQQLLSVARYGTPAALRDLPAIRNIEELSQIYGAYRQDIVDIQQLANPNNAKTTFNQILSEYQQPNWQGWKTSGGIPISPGISSFQFPTTNYNIADSVATKIQELMEKKKTLQSQRDSALSSLQNATDASQVAKYHALITGLNGALADINAHIQQVSETGNLQRQKTQARTRNKQDRADATNTSKRLSGNRSRSNERRTGWRP
jgi:hypothetical protein